MTPSSSIKGILLDLDDTLYEYASCNTAGKETGLLFLEKKLQKNYSELQEQYEKAREAVKDDIVKAAGFETAASHSRLLYFQRLLEQVTGISNPLLALEAADQFWGAYFRNMELFPGAREFLENMKRLGKKIVIVTDMEHSIQLQKVIRLDISNLIDIIVSSEEAGHEKPHPAPLLMALKKTGLRPNEVVFIGDSEKKDVAAAHAIGIRPIVLHIPPQNPTVVFAPDFHHLMDLLHL